MVRIIPKTILTSAFVLAASVIVAFPAGASNGTEKVPVLRFPNGSCATGAVPNSGASVGFAVINKNGSGSVSAEVSLKNGLPNHTYSVSLVQTPSGENCFATEATLTTNAEGNGNVHVDEALLPGSTDAFVLLQTPGDFLASPDVVF